MRGSRQLKLEQQLPAARMGRLRPLARRGSMHRCFNPDASCHAFWLPRELLTYRAWLSCSRRHGPTRHSATRGVSGIANWHALRLPASTELESAGLGTCTCAPRSEIGNAGRYNDGSQRAWLGKGKEARSGCECHVHAAPQPSYSAFDVIRKQRELLAAHQRMVLMVRSACSEALAKQGYDDTLGGRQ